jgi:hypothetical protein
MRFRSIHSPVWVLEIRPATCGPEIVGSGSWIVYKEELVEVILSFMTEGALRVRLGRRRSLTKSVDGRIATEVARLKRKKLIQGKTKPRLTPTGLVMEGLDRRARTQTPVFISKGQ